MVVENRLAASSSKSLETGEDSAITDSSGTTRDWVSLREFAKIIGVTYQTALRYKDDGNIRVSRIGGRFRVTLEEVERFQKEGNLPSSFNSDEG